MKVLTVEQIKNAEKTAVSNGLFSYADLMYNAGKAVFDEICRRYTISGKRFLILIGNGNNGGDGLVLADFLRKGGALVELFAPFGLPKTDVAQKFSKAADFVPICENISDSYDFYVDALFGIGLSRDFSPEITKLIETVNSYTGIKTAIDVPSGVIADGGRVNTVFRADLTITFIGYKLCQLLPETSDFCGEIVLNDLGIDTKSNYSYTIIGEPCVRTYNKNSHKGTFGTALTICGSYGMCGAGILSAKAAVNSGAGVLKSIVCDKNYSAFTQSVPEAVTLPVATANSGAPIVSDEVIYSALHGISSLLIGCGLGNGSEIKTLVKKVLKNSNVPTVLDADGINSIVGDIDILTGMRAPKILTPHPGEMARLLNTTVADIEKRRIYFAKSFACDYNCVLVLKGANTIVAAPNGELYFNITGNYGMAKGGSGDVLSGIIVALLANGYNPLEAAITAVYVHGKAGDLAAAKYTKRTVTPGDVINELKHITF